MQPLQGRGNVPDPVIVNTDVPLATVDVVINGTPTRINASDYRAGMQLAEGQQAPAGFEAGNNPSPAGTLVPPLPGASEPGNLIPPANPDANNGGNNGQPDATVVPLADRVIAKHGKQFFIADKNGKKLDANGRQDDNAGGFDTEEAARATLVPPAAGNQ